MNVTQSRSGIMKIMEIEPKKKSRNPKNLIRHSSETHFDKHSSYRVIIPSISQDFIKFKPAKKINYDPKLKASASGSITNLLEVTPFEKKVYKKLAYKIHEDSSIFIPEIPKIKPRKTSFDIEDLSGYAGNYSRHKCDELKNYFNERIIIKKYNLADLYRPDKEKKNSVDNKSRNVKQINKYNTMSSSNYTLKKSTHRGTSYTINSSIDTNIASKDTLKNRKNIKFK